MHPFGELYLYMLHSGTPRVIPTEIAQCATDYIPWNFSSDLGSNKCNPAKSFRWSFSDFVQISLRYKSWQVLLNQSVKNHKEHKQKTSDFAIPVMTYQLCKMKIR